MWSGLYAIEFETFSCSVRPQHTTTITDIIDEESCDFAKYNLHKVEPFFAEDDF